MHRRLKDDTSSHFSALEVLSIAVADGLGKRGGGAYHRTWPMRSPALGCLVVASLAHPAALLAQSGGERSVTVLATVTVAPRTSLKTSARVLEFRIEPGTNEALAVVEFTAAARALPDADVVMTIAPDGGLTGPGGAADVEADLTFSGDGSGTLSGILMTTQSVTTARWTGGGVRSGRLVFRLRTLSPGAYTLPVRFAISVP
jgi:hypothetical protein